MVTQKQLHGLFRYHPGGLLIWDDPPTNRTKIGNVAGSKRRDGYRQIGIDGKIYLTHRLIYLFHHGYTPKHIDHINREKWDNRIENLRDAKGMNGANRTKSKNKYSQYRGVTWCKGKKKWKAVCKEKHIGYFDFEVDAARAYNFAADFFFKKFAHLNDVL